MAAIVIGLLMMSSAAIWAASIGLSAAITSAIVPSFIQNYGWEKGFLLLGGMYAVALFLGAFLLIEKPADVGMLPYGVTED